MKRQAFEWHFPEARHAVSYTDLVLARAAEAMRKKMITGKESPSLVG